MSTKPSRPALRSVIALVAGTLLLTGCSNLIAGEATKIGSTLGQSKTSPPDGPSGRKANAPAPDIKVDDDANTEWDVQAKDTIADLYDYYGSIFEKDFGKKFTPAKQLKSYDSSDPKATICNRSLKGDVNASYNPMCDAIVWDRGKLLPDMGATVGPLGAPTILAHEMGHLVQARLGFKVTNQAELLTAEQQADCYAGAYWRWVADGNSKYYDLSQGKGMREVLTAIMYTGDPVGLSPEALNAHGSAFDRAFAMSLGYTNGAVRCSKIDDKEVTDRITETGFTYVPKNYGNLPVDQSLVDKVTATLDSYFAERFKGYRKPTIKAFDGEQGPECGGAPSTFPVGYCAADNTVTYNLAELKRLATPTKGFASYNGDFSSMLMLASRYGLAAQATTGGQVTGDQAGLRALCYAGTWAAWLHEGAHGGLKLSPNDLNKAVYAVMNSSLPAADATGATSTRVIDQVQALYLGVIYGQTTRCYEFYSG